MRTVCRSKQVARSKPIRFEPHVHNELAFLKSRTKLRAIAAVAPTRPGLGGIRAFGIDVPATSPGGA